jgi:hypothetical protein
MSGKTTETKNNQPLILRDNFNGSTQNKQEDHQSSKETAHAENTANNVIQQRYSSF